MTSPETGTYVIPMDDPPHKAPADTPVEGQFISRPNRTPPLRRSSSMLGSMLGLQSPSVRLIKEALKSLPQTSQNKEAPAAIS